MAKYFEEENVKKEFRDVGKYLLSEDDIADLMESIPADEVALVVHGRWKENDNFDDGFWVCSSCGFVSADTAAHKLYNFCPNCGAKMDLEE